MMVGSKIGQVTAYDEALNEKIKYSMVGGRAKLKSGDAERVSRYKSGQLEIDFDIGEIRLN